MKNRSPANRSTTGPYIAKRRPLSRRHFLRGLGVGVSLPLLDSMVPAFGRTAWAQDATTATAAGAPPHRLLAVCNNLGVLPEHFFPAGTGRDYTPSPYLEVLAGHRDRFTVFSGVSHPNVDGGHPSDISFLTAAPHPASGSFRNTISIDQHIGEHLGVATRFPSLTLAVNTGNRSLSWTGAGVAIPPEQSAAEVFNQLFLQGTADQVERRVREIDTGRSILDAISDQAADLQRRVGPQDRQRLDQYFTSVRDLESRLQASRGWEHRPKPAVDAQPPTDPPSPAQYMAKVRNMYHLARLAFETDSTRAISLMLNSVGTPVLQIQGATITDDYHNLSHHGKAPDKLEQLRLIDIEHMRLLDELFTSMASVTEGERNLFDQSMVLYGSNLGDANAHSTTNMPVLFAGGGFKHAGHLAFDKSRNYPLPNLFVSILQRMGIEQDRFASSTGTMSGLEMNG